MLVATDDGGPGEVYHVMEKAPISWGPILILENVQSTLSLYSRVVEHEPALVNAWRSEHSKVLTADGLGAALKALGYTPDKPRFSSKQVHLNSAETAEEDVGGAGASSGESNELLEEDEVFRQVYATLKAKKRSEPTGGYPFPKNDHVVTKLGKLPPGPCRLCGSEKHWNRECPNYVVYSEGIKRTANIAAAMEPTEEETMYQSLFTVLLNQTLSKGSYDFGSIGGSFFESAALKTEVSRRKTAAKTEKMGPGGFQEIEIHRSSAINEPPSSAKDNCRNSETHQSHGSFEQDTYANKRMNRSRVEIEEMPDKEDGLWEQMPKAEEGILESSTPDVEKVNQVETPLIKTWESSKRAREAARFSKMVEEYWLNDGHLFEPMLENAEGSEDDGGEDEEEEYRRANESIGIQPDEKEVSLASMSEAEAEAFAKQAHTLPPLYLPFGSSREGRRTWENLLWELQCCL
ncbi:hypothetical protein B0H13DRAFT_2333315 [Mycena leptocephala]|nr:hypothetical protein B0H13DRAFT_2333315 [Mycena leptocephala]